MNEKSKILKPEFYNLIAQHTAKSPRRHWRENAKKRKKKEKENLPVNPNTIQKAKYKNIHIKITNMKNLKKLNNIKLN